MKKLKEIYLIDSHLVNNYQKVYQLHINFLKGELPKKYYLKKKIEYEIELNQNLIEEKIAWASLLNSETGIKKKMQILENQVELSVENILFEPTLDPFYRMYCYLYYQIFLQEIEKFSMNMSRSTKERYAFYNQLYFYSFFEKLVQISHKDAFFSQQSEFALQLYQNIFYKIPFLNHIEDNQNFEAQAIKKANLSWHEYKRYKKMLAEESLRDLLDDFNTLSLENFQICLFDLHFLIYIKTLLKILIDATIIREIIDNSLVDARKKEMLYEVINAFFPETLRFRLIRM